MKNVTWYGDRWKSAMRAEARKRNSAGAIAVFNRAKILTSHEGAGSRVRVKGTGGRNAKGHFTGGQTEIVQSRGGRRQIGKLIYGAFPSRPGDPPNRQTGRGSGSIAWENVSDTIARIGTNLRYFGRWVEGGTRKMAARPWLRRSLKEMTPFIQAVWNRPWRGPGV